MKHAFNTFRAFMAPKHRRRTFPRWRLPLVLLGCLGLAGSTFGFYSYAQVQTLARTFTSVDDIAPGETFIPQGASGDLLWRAQLPHHLLTQALETLMPEIMYEGREVQSLVPYWSIDEIEVELEFRARRLGKPVVNLLGKQIEIVQPARLEVTGTAPGVEETETREFALAARYEIGIGPDWQIQLTSIREPRLLGFVTPRLFAAVEPDIDALDRDISAKLVNSLTPRLTEALNAKGGFRPLATDLATHLASGAALDGERKWPGLRVAGAHIVEQSVSQSGHDFQLALRLEESGEGESVTLPKLSAEKVDLRPLEVPFSFDARVAEIASLLKKNEGPMAIAGGELSVNKIKILRPHGNALLVKVDADEIDPGGHRFEKRGTFHVLMELKFDTENQAIVVSRAEMPEDTSLNLAVSGRDWLRSNELALGLVSGLSSLSRGAEVRDLVRGIRSQVEQSTELASGLAVWSTGSLGLAEEPTSYSDSVVATNFRARLTPVVEFGL